MDVDDPWGFGNSLEWATSCPPPLRNFDRRPRIRSERPAFEAKYGPMVADLGRDLPQRETKPPQTLGDELYREQPAPESPSAEGAYGPREVTDYQPAPESGARSVQVPDPDQVRRPAFDQTEEPGRDPLGGRRSPTDRGTERWRRPGAEDDQ